MKQTTPSSSGRSPGSRRSRYWAPRLPSAGPGGIHPEPIAGVGEVRGPGEPSRNSGWFSPLVERLALPVRTLGWLVSQTWSSLCEPPVWSVPQHDLPLPRSPGSPGLQSRVLGSEMGLLLGPAPLPTRSGSLAGPETSLLCRQHQPPPCPLPRPLTQLPIRPRCSHSVSHRLLEILSRGRGAGAGGHRDEVLRVGPAGL